MKEKLEAVTGSRKSSVRSTQDDKRKRSELGDDVLGDVSKLSESRKMLLEQQLGAGTRVIAKPFSDLSSESLRSS